MNEYMEATKLLDYNNDDIRALVLEKNWGILGSEQKIEKIYNFVRDEVKFGYNERDDIPASKVLADGYGQCNTKAILFMAILRSVKIPCRLHGFTINKKLQKGAISGIWYILTPRNLIHSWVEIYSDENWLTAEGIILDKGYVASVQNKFSKCHGIFCGYGIATTSFENPAIEWKGKSTYIQSEGINGDLGIYDNPDIFLRLNQQNIGKVRLFLFKHIIRHLINRKLEAIRHKTL